MMPLAMCVGIVFGAIHCIAWSFHFATLQERWVWRICAILVSGLPILLVAVPFFYRIFRDWFGHFYKIFMRYTSIVIMIFYIIARIALLVLPFVALRALPPGAYVQLNWISFLPHI